LTKHKSLATKGSLRNRHLGGDDKSEGYWRPGRILTA
jgi:hypothetical protein